ncbi:MAG: ribosome-associated protein [Acidobacteriota bacterium]|nr:ribosome-associated protein [Acidobacteriota bacterium]
MEQNSPMPESRERTEKGREPQGEASVEAQTTAATEASANSVAGVEALDERVRLSLVAASEKKAHDLVVLDLREIASFTDFFAIASGTNVRQVQAIADAVQEQLRKNLRVKPARVEGYNSAEWVLLDYGDFIFHVFEEKSRRFYDLERLWRDAARINLPPELSGGQGGGSLRDER